MADWQMRDATTRFSEVIERAQVEGPQTIMRHGSPHAVLIDDGGVA